MKYTLSDPKEFCEKLYESVVDYGSGFARDSALECLVQNYESSSVYDESIGIYFGIQNFIERTVSDPYQITSDEVVDILEVVQKGDVKDLHYGIFVSDFGDFKEMAPDDVARFVCDQIAEGLKSGKEYELEELTRLTDGLIDEKDYKDVFKGILIPTEKSLSLNL